MRWRRARSLLYSKAMDARIVIGCVTMYKCDSTDYVVT